MDSDSDDEQMRQAIALSLQERMTLLHDMEMGFILKLNIDL